MRTKIYFLSQPIDGWDKGDKTIAYGKAKYHKKQGRKRPQICIKCNKRGTFGERKRKREREKER